MGRAHGSTGVVGQDVAFHLLDVDLSWLARDRDHDQAGIIPVPADHQEFVRGLALG
jgi:hypothetical protein